MPSGALRLAEVAREIGLDPAASKVRVTVHAGEPGASIPATQAAIEAAFSAKCFDHTGMTELGPTGHSCSQRDGIHAAESEFISEILDENGRTADEGLRDAAPSLTPAYGRVTIGDASRWALAGMRSHAREE
jgi:Coenzyme F390 synthetase